MTTHDFCHAFLKSFRITSLRIQKKIGKTRPFIIYEIFYKLLSKATELEDRLGSWSISHQFQRLD